MGPWPVGVLSLALYNGSGPISKPGLERWLAFPAFCFRSPVPPGLHIGKPESCRHATPTTQAQKAPPATSDNPRSERNLRAQYEVIPILGCPIFPKDGGPRPAAICPSNLLPELFTALAPPGGPLLFRAISGQPQHAGETKCPGRWRAGRSAGLPNAVQFSGALCPNRSRFGRMLVRIGQKMPGEDSSGAAFLQSHPPGACPGFVIARTQTPPIGTARDQLRRDQRLWILGLRGSHPWRYTMGRGQSQRPGSIARSLPQPSVSGVLFLVASI